MARTLEEIVNDPASSAETKKAAGKVITTANQNREMIRRAQQQVEFSPEWAALRLQYTIEFLVDVGVLTEDQYVQHMLGWEQKARTFMQDVLAQIKELQSRQTAGQLAVARKSGLIVPGRG